MRLPVSQRIKLKVSAQIIFTGFVLGLIFVFFANGTGQLYPFINGAVIGLLIGSVIAILELVFFARGAKRIKFIWLLILRTGIYLILIIMIILNVVVVSRMNLFGLTYIEVWQSAELKDYLTRGNFPVAVIYTLIFAFSVHFIRMISRKMGQGVLISYITGTYYKPVHQQRIIMFLKVQDSDRVLQELGPMAFHKFLNNLFYDLTVPVVLHQGIIYEYVEDLMVLTWTLNKGLFDANCLKVYFAITETISNNRQAYIEKYGFVPKIVAGLHQGTVVHAEIGEVKTQIVLQGDTMNTTARILNQSIKLKAGLLASSAIIELAEIPFGYDTRIAGEFNLKGKQEKVTLIEIFKGKSNDA